jgi:hypothetical protein
LFEHFAAEVFDFFINNSTTTVAPSEDIPYKIVQSIGAIGTFGAFVFIGIQTYILRRQTASLATQTNILQHEYDINFRPWIILERESDTQPIDISIEPDKNMVTATFRFRNQGKLSTTSAQGVFDVAIEQMTDLGTRDLQLVLPKAFPPGKIITYSESRDDPDLMKDIFDKGYFYVGFYMAYFYTDRVRNTIGTGRYYVLIHVRVGFADLGDAGKRINTKTMNIVHEHPE